MKNKKELDDLKKEVETFKSKLAELTEEELIQVTGGVEPFNTPKATENNDTQYEIHIYKDSEIDFKPKFDK